MELIKPSVELVTEKDQLKKLELIGRVCWASEDRITEGSAEKFVNMLIKHKTESVLEHSNIIVHTIGEYNTMHMRELLTEYENRSGLPSYIRNCGSELPEAAFCDDIWSGNIRAWRSLCKMFCGEEILICAFEHHPLFKDINFPPLSIYDCDDYWDDEPEEFTYNGYKYRVTYPVSEIIDKDPLDRDRHKVATFKIVCDRGITHELVRHRIASPTQRSTRYCDESNLRCIEPWWYEDASQEDKQILCGALTLEEGNYCAMQQMEDHSPQKSRVVLPTGTASVLYMTATLEDWKTRILPLRTAKNAHPDARVVAGMIKELL